MSDFLPPRPREGIKFFAHPLIQWSQSIFHYNQEYYLGLDTQQHCNPVVSPHLDETLYVESDELWYLEAFRTGIIIQLLICTVRFWNAISERSQQLQSNFITRHYRRYFHFTMFEPWLDAAVSEQQWGGT